MTTEKDLADRRYLATYIIESAIIDAISRAHPSLTLHSARDIYKEWKDEEDGMIAVDRLVTLVL